MTRVKICGLMNPSDVAMAVGAGADALGFVTEYPIPVPWNLDQDVSRHLIAQAPPFVTTTAVVGGSVANMVAIARHVRPDVLQLHGDETVDEVREVCAALVPDGIKVIKALRIDIDTGLAQFSDPDPVGAASALATAGIAALVIDSKTSTRPAGTGVPLDRDLVLRVAETLAIPFILAGGLNPANVGDAVEQVRPFAVDVISGIEERAGVKDACLMNAFVAAVRGAQSGGSAA
ncbi:MAG: phosphoribosylanthranilate isomerase [Lentisphaerae bacterium]|jgi:phosphoribosylanthranilate isomerase|nr:phosphoribosylanthranilate isomerase [Lentisphaerota bacterium]MBT4814852.1 phosphoribosylanthranilate isomerase [Lentisphaerota bacterium]MBT5612634.1 phosphoribosylanthranilate isomerase [Lentisphaerota bacterium]MBT7057355.1 phosphoribosylanthranilate isomerase [Lentisphaerota bacterium]MBT7846453.1 phosphoribosylanthranilate isomerase [Lentisphaerota bacterium]